NTFAAQRMQEIQPLHVGEVIVEQHQVERAMPQDNEGISTGATTDHLMARPLQALANEQGFVVVVFNQEQSQAIGHVLAPNPSNVTVKMLPLPGSDWALTVPPRLSTSRRTRNSPRPLPTAGPSLPGKGSNNRWRRS